MRVLQVHSRYLSGTGGEDTVVEMERRLLESRGHVVEQFLGSNASLDTRGTFGALKTGLNSIWSAQSYHDLLKTITQVKPDIIHVHNTFAALSPSVFWAARRAGVGSVMTVHNYRTLCATSLLLRDDAPCEECVGRLPLPALVHRCRYGSSLATGAAISATAVMHRCLGTYSHKVNVFIALSDFAKSILIRGGFPSQRIHVKPNYVEDVFDAAGVSQDREKQIVFVGLINRAKGIDLLLSAWSKMRSHGWRLVIIGKGPEMDSLSELYKDQDDIVWRGQQEHKAVLEEISRSRFLVLPTRAYEGFPMTVVEALSLATPVIVPDHGPFPQIVDSGKNALLFEPNNAESLGSAISKAISMDDSNWVNYSNVARNAYLERYTDEINYQQLMTIYEHAMQL